MKPSLSLLALLFCPAPAEAQTRPLVEVAPAAKAAPRPHLAPQRVGVGDCYGVPGAELEELAFIRVTLPGAWERTAEHLAKEKAGELGANCLLPAGGGGLDNMRGPAQRAYKAYRVTVPMGPYQVPAPPESLPAAGGGVTGPAGRFQSAGFRQLTPPAEHSAHLGWLGSAAVVVHLVAIDPAAAGAELWGDILKDAEEYFPAAEAAVLAAAKNRTAVGIDLINLSVTIPGKEPGPLAPVLGGAQSGLQPDRHYRRNQ
ncbi:MAG: hypothetical protein RDU13_11040 [Elusimicrobiales bacterium]|nr:hypothetical protein [Elusimicrobiales bacterium]